MQATGLEPSREGRREWGERGRGGRGGGAAAAQLGETDVASPATKSHSLSRPKSWWGWLPLGAGSANGRRPARRQARLGTARQSAVRRNDGCRRFVHHTFEHDELFRLSGLFADGDESIDIVDSNPSLLISQQKMLFPSRIKLMSPGST